MLISLILIFIFILIVISIKYIIKQKKLNNNRTDLQCQ